MSTIVYQKLQPCYDSNNYMESRRLSLKLNPPSDNFSKSNDSYSNMFGWSGIGDTTSKAQPEYIHPLVKKSSSKLSQKSLEMCTESLGCETGTCIMDNSVFLESRTGKSRRKTMETEKQNNQVVIKSLPPPLTTLTGPNPIQVKPVREDGRLVIKAVSSPIKRACLRAERSNGRLKLSLIDDNFGDDENNQSTDYETSVTNDNGNDYDDDNDNDNDNDEGQCTEIVSDKKEEDESLGEKMKEIKIMGVVKKQIASRCKERGQGNKRLVVNYWEPFWVAT
ncbi:hypothetical protein RND81_05G145700 [Saponaria officinalis]|uniref:FAF domain-containing protein n=1 Tax=Saponaria officinalis TaxID=3572 RepID=A0AAW1KSG1_SAPOF